MSVGKQYDWRLGTEDSRSAAEDELIVWSIFRELLDIRSEDTENGGQPARLEDIALRKSRLDAPLLVSLKTILAERNVQTDARVRVGHSYGRSYADVVRLWAGHVPNPPDAVVFPEDEGQIAALLSWASERDVLLVPYGGGSSLTGGVEPPRGDQPVLTIDMRNLSRALRVDGSSLTAQIQAGAKGPLIESCVNTQGYTLGYSPQSFRFSTLGGWLATRAYGHSVGQFTSIDSVSLAVKAVTPAGLVEAGRTTATGTGIDMLQVLIGSEGSYGVITEATVRILPLPEVHDYRGVLFPTFEEGIAACQVLVSNEHLRPTVVQLLDSAETSVLALLGRQRRGLGGLLDSLAAWYQSGRRRHNGVGSSLLFLGFEGNPDWIARQWAVALNVCRDHRGVLTGKASRRTWENLRDLYPNLRDVMISHGIMMDTVAVSTTWSSLLAIRAAIAGAIRGAITAVGAESGYLMTHLSNPSRNGITVHTTFLAKQDSDPDPLVKEKQWLIVRQAVREATLSQGGTVHHDWLAQSTSVDPPHAQRALEARLRRSIQKVLDPKGTMVPAASPAQLSNQ